MIKIEAITLEDAYKSAASQLGCSITEINIEVVQTPTSGILGFFKKNAIIVAARKTDIQEKTPHTSEIEPTDSQSTAPSSLEAEQTPQHTMLHDTMMPVSFVNDQDEEEDIGSGLEYTADYDDAYDESLDDGYEDESLDEVLSLDTIVQEVQHDIEHLFSLICFDIDEIKVSAYDKETLLIEFNGEDAALLIGKEGYRYKSLSYMLFNWINAKYNLGLRLEIAEFLKNQEESIGRYLESVHESIARDGRAQTKILDGVLVQIALKELREHYPDKYVVIRSTRDGLKYIIVNDYHH